MTAPSGPDEHPQTLNSSGSSERKSFVYDSPNTEIDPGYMPEREFVLMPLFRRIGQLLGIRRQDDQQYYEPELPSSHLASSTAAPESPADVHTVRSEQADPVVDRADAQPLREFTNVTQSPGTTAFEHTQPASEQQIAAFSEPITSAPSVMLSEPLTSPELSPFGEPANPSDTYTSYSVQSDPDREHLSAEREPPSSSVAVNEKPEPEVIRARTAEEIRELVAPLREAAAKISAAVSQAAEWLHTKEEEILRRAEPSAPPAQNGPMVVTPINDYVGPAEASVDSRPAWADQHRAAAPIDAVVAREASDRAPEWEPINVPGLQREVAWVDQPEPTAAGSPRPQPTPLFRAGKTGPRLIHASARVPFWKRVDWEQQFTSKRVAVIGAVVMAMLLIAGISLARRPAAEMLPQQTRTSLQPGGVTLSTHPTATPRGTRQPQQRPAPAATQRSVAPTSSRQQRAATEDDGADVVTHYYRKRAQKPSPVRQTVAGVRHYSDMQ